MRKEKIVDAVFSDVGETPTHFTQKQKSVSALCQTASVQSNMWAVNKMKWIDKSASVRWTNLNSYWAARDFFFKSYLILFL